MGLAEDRGWVETDLDGAMGRWVFSERDGFAALRAETVRFLREGQPQDWTYYDPPARRDYGRCGSTRVCDMIIARELSYAQLSRGTPIDRKGRPVPFDSVEMECVLRNGEQVYDVFTVRTEEECKSLRFRLVGQLLPNPRVQDIREGKQYFYRNLSNKTWVWVQVTKVYNFPTTDKICDVLAQDGGAISIDRSNFHLLTLPLSGLENYQDMPDAGEAAGIDRGVRERELQLHAVREGQTANICWQPVAGAASFRVTLYRRVDVQWPGFVPLYHLADYETDRDTHFLSVSGLVGPGLLYRVTALDRTGNELACSRARDL